MNIVKFPDPILRESVEAFNFENPPEDPKQLEKDMLEFMYANNGIGLAATQIGKRLRVFVMGHKDSPDLGTAFFNPVVLSCTKEVKEMEEGCLSFPGIFAKIKRPSAVKVQWQNSSGVVQQGEFEGYDCKCFLHELDHLEGIVFKDRISPLKWALAVKQSTKGNKRVGTK